MILVYRELWHKLVKLDNYRENDLVHQLFVSGPRKLAVDRDWALNNQSRTTLMRIHISPMKMDSSNESLTIGNNIKILHCREWGAEKPKKDQIVCNSSQLCRNPFSKTVGVSSISNVVSVFTSRK